jgi:hypothetical protein
LKEREKRHKENELNKQIEGERGGMRGRGKSGEAKV